MKGSTKQSINMYAFKRYKKHPLFIWSHKKLIENKTEKNLKKLINFSLFCWNIFEIKNIWRTNLFDWEGGNTTEKAKHGYNYLNYILQWVATNNLALTLIWWYSLGFNRWCTNGWFGWWFQNITILRYHQHRYEVHNGQWQELGLLRFILEHSFLIKIYIIRQQFTPWMVLTNSILFCFCILLFGKSGF